MTRKLLAVIAALSLPVAALAADTSPTTKDAKADAMKAEAKTQRAVGNDTGAAKAEAKADMNKAGASAQKTVNKGKARVKKASPRRHHHRRTTRRTSPNTNLRY